jgi:hypothetical protein
MGQAKGLSFPVGFGKIHLDKGCLFTKAIFLPIRGQITNPDVTFTLAFSGGLGINLGFFDIFGDNLLEFARSIYFVQAKEATIVSLFLNQFFDFLLFLRWELLFYEWKK